MVLIGGDGGMWATILFMASTKRGHWGGGVLRNLVFLGVSRRMTANDAGFERAIFEEAVQEEGGGAL